MAKITYDNKITLNEQPSIADVNKVKDSDMNEIKSVVNTNDDNVGALTNLNTTNKTSIVNAINEVLTDIANLVSFTKHTLSSNTSIVNNDASYYIVLGNLVFLSIADLQFKAAVSGTTTILSGAPAPASDVPFLITRMDGSVARLHVGSDGNVKDWYSNIDANTGGSGYWYGFVAYIKA